MGVNLICVRYHLEHTTSHFFNITYIKSTLKDFQNVYPLGYFLYEEWIYKNH